MNPNVNDRAVTRRGSRRENALEIFRDYDVVADGTDNFPTRYLVNDACVLTGKPNVYGSIFRFEGQASVFWRGEGPVLPLPYPEPPPPGLVPSLRRGGVLGILPGLLGVDPGDRNDQAVLGIGEPLVGRLLSWTRSRCGFASSSCARTRTASSAGRIRRSRSSSTTRSSAASRRRR